MLIPVSGRVRLAAGALCMALLVVACSHHRPDYRHYRTLPVAAAQELAGTPFFPQEDYQCGPAALATVLASEGLDISPAELRPLVYLPDNRGSLQAEMLAAPSHFEYLAIPLPGSMDALLQALSAGQPVVVLQNFGLAWLPVWHYAVAIGYDLETGEIYLRSGTDERRVYGFRVFLKSWSRAGHWAMVVAAPGTVPAAVTETGYLQAASTLERRQHHAAALQAFTAATRRWPDNYLAWAGSGNAAYRLGRFQDAGQAYRRALQLNPDAAAVMNNLAYALAEQGCRQIALAVLQCALERSGESATLAASREEIGAFPAGAEGCRPFHCGEGAESARQR